MVRREIARAVMFAAWTGMLSAAEFPPVAELPVLKELPNPLVMLDGTPVTTQEQWLTKRRPELQQLFQHYMYGYLPPKPKLAATAR